MEFLVQYILPIVLIYKYTALFVVSFFAAFILPIPSGSILMAVSAFASDGYFNIIKVIIISIVANILGDNLGYFISYRYGSKILSAIGFERILKSKTFNMIEEKFREKPGFIIYISRFEVISTLIVNLLSGMGKIQYKKYIRHEIFGTISQIIFYSMIGYTFGYGFQSITSTVGKIFSVLIIILLIILIPYSKKYIYK